MGVVDRDGFSWIPMPGLLAVIAGLSFAGGSVSAQPSRPRFISALHRSGLDILHLRFSADSRVLAAQSGYEVAVWETATWQERVVARPPDPENLLTTFDLTLDGRRVASQNSGQPGLWDLPTGKFKLFPAAEGCSYGVAFSPDGRVLAVGMKEEGRVVLLDVDNGAKLTTLRGKHHVFSLAFSPDGRLLAVTEGPQGVPTFVRLWDVERRQERATLAIPKSRLWSHALTFSADGKTLATIDDNLVQVWDVSTARLRATFKIVGRSWVGLSPDGRVVLAGIGLPWKGSEVSGWEVESGKQLPSLRLHNDLVECVALSPDGCLLAAACWQRKNGKLINDKVVKVWDVSSLTGVPPPTQVPLPAQPAGLRADKDASVPDRRVNLKAEEMELLWSDLRNEDARQAYRSVWALADSPGRSVPFLAERLRPAPSVEPRRVDRLLAGLDSEDFAARERATEELAGLGKSANLALRRELALPRSEETRRRVEQLLDSLQARVWAPQGEELREVRAVEALERAGTVGAWRLLSALATGAVEARLTHEARLALERLAHRPPLSAP